jgi:hypothetical protein
MRLSIKTIDQIAKKDFNITDLTYMEAEGIRLNVIVSNRLSNFRNNHYSAFDTENLINNWMHSVSLSVGLSSIISLIMIITLKLDYTILSSNYLWSFGGATFGTFLFASIFTLHQKYKEQQIAINELYSILAKIEYERYQSQFDGSIAVTA